MKVNIVMGRDADRLISNLDFREQWKQLHQRCSWASVFQDVGFVVTWYDTYRKIFTPVIITGTNQVGELVGLFPLAHENESGKLVVAGDDQAEYQAWLSDPQDNNDFIETALGKLSEEFPNRALRLLFVLPTTPIDWARPGKRWSSYTYVKSLPRGLMTIGDGSAFKAPLRKKQNKINRLKRLGNLRFDRIQDPEELEALFNEVMTYQALRLRATYNLNNVPHDPLKRSFFVNLMRLPRMIHATALRLDERLVSAQLHIYNNDQVLLWLITHSPLYAKYSPGALHTLMLALELAKEGAPIFDLTPGGEYKDRYATHYDHVHVITIFFNRTQYLQNKIKLNLANVTKSALQVFNLGPAQVKDSYAILVDRAKKWLHLKPTTLISGLIRKLKRSLWYKEEWLVYTFDLERVSRLPVMRSVNKNYIPDLLAYRPVEAWQPPVNRFLKQAMENLEDGNHVYTQAEGEQLLFYGWLTHPQEKSSMTGVVRDLDPSPDSLVLTDYYLSRQTQSVDIPRSAICQMLHDASKNPGIKQVYNCVLSNNWQFRRIIEELGFTHRYTLYKHGFLGKTEDRAVSQLDLH